MNLKPVFIDVETFWSQTHSLSKMSPLDYVMHADTEIQMFACKFGRKANTDVIVGEAEIKAAVSKIDWSDKFVIAHNMSGFDALVLAWRLGIRPAMWGCTLAMARPIHAKTTGLSLAKLVQHYEIGTKNQQALIETRGKRLSDFTADELRRMQIYNADDTDQATELFYRLLPHYTTAELWHIDAKIRALVEPKLELDMDLLRSALVDEQRDKHEDLMELAELMGVEGIDDEARAEAVRAQLASSAKFSDLLTSMGAEVPMKESNTVAGKMIPAVSKTDEGMKELLDHPSHLVAAAARGRLAVKSTILETRLEAFIHAGEVTGGKWPVTTHYCGADTTGRPSGWLYNPLNLPRVGKERRRSDALRKSIRAPKGHVVVVSDSSGIELRFNHFLWMVPYSTKLWSEQADADLYRASAAKMHNIPPEQVSPDQRQFSKVLNLACGYQMGPVKFRTTARNAPGGKDIPVLVRMPDGSEVEVFGDRQITEVLARTDVEVVSDEAREGVYGWRRVNKEIVDGWQRCADVLEYIAGGREVEIDPWGMFVTCAEGIRMPSGRLIRYPDLRLEADEKTGRKQWTYGYGRHTAKLYGGKVDENCLAHGTLVLTLRGWKPIERITKDDLVHDGVEFVRHDGLIYKGVADCVVVDGVNMTPDHEVLTDDGWKAALENPRPYRPAFWGARDAERVAQHGEEAALGIPVQLRGDDHQVRDGRDPGSQAGRHTQLRMSDLVADLGGELGTWAEQDRHLCSVVQHDRKVPSAKPQGIPPVRRAWDNSVRFLARFVRSVLRGHGTDVHEGANSGAHGQRPGVQPDELRVGYQGRPGAESEGRDPGGKYPGTLTYHGNQPVDSVLPVRQRTTPHRVYDILNCGPRHRFVVLGSDGPFVVHNCVQAGARDVIYDIALNVFKASGFRYSNEVYDELVYVVPETVAEDFLALLQAEMRKPTRWFPSLIKWSEGDIATCYGDAK